MHRESRLGWNYNGDINTRILEKKYAYVTYFINITTIETFSYHLEDLFQ